MIPAYSLGFIGCQDRQIVSLARLTLLGFCTNRYRPLREGVLAHHTSADAKGLFTLSLVAPKLRRKTEYFETSPDANLQNAMADLQGCWKATRANMAYYVAQKHVCGSVLPAGPDSAAASASRGFFIWIEDFQAWPDL